MSKQHTNPGHVLNTLMRAEWMDDYALLLEQSVQANRAIHPVSACTHRWCDAKNQIEHMMDGLLCWFSFVAGAAVLVPLETLGIRSDYTRDPSLHF